MSSFIVQNGKAIIRRLEGRFDLKPIDSEPFVLPNTILLVSDADKAIRTSDVKAETVTISSTGLVDFHTIPDDERWYLVAVYAGQLSGDYTAHKFYVKGVDGTVVFLEEFTAAATYVKLMPYRIVLDPKMILGLRFNAGTTSGDWFMRCLIEKEQIL